MAFGTFDLLHPGHINFLNQAKKHGQLIIVIARDKTVKEVKGKLPQHKEKQEKEEKMESHQKKNEKTREKKEE